jgi:hypothetical protein
MVCSKARHAVQGLCGGRGRPSLCFGTWWTRLENRRPRKEQGTQRCPVFLLIFGWREWNRTTDPYRVKATQGSYLHTNACQCTLSAQKGMGGSAWGCTRMLGYAR